ncbi:MAG: hypothetical protein AMXMBFR47_09830 [Planctomycetota bacterium]
MLQFGGIGPMKMSARMILGIILVAATNFSAAAGDGSPDLRTINPTGVQRGVSAKLRLVGARLTSPQAIIFYQPGIAVTALTAENAENVIADCTIAPDCPLGEHALRLRTSGGLTELRTVFVGALPCVDEVEPNSDFAAPQKVALDSTIAGTVTSEDIDYYAVDLKAGDRIVAEIEAMRLGRAMFDPSIAILDSRRFELATCDDSSLLLQDSVAAAIAPSDGTYVVAVREASYGGGDNFAYRLHVTGAPRPIVAFPPGAQSGETLPLTLLGDPKGAIGKSVTIPADAAGLWPLWLDDGGSTTPSPVWLWISPMSQLVEGVPPPPTVPPASPASAPADPASQPAATQPLPTAPPASPIAFAGVIGEPGQTDTWRFSARKDQQLEIRVIARRIRSPLDSVITVANAAGEGAASNDDAVGPDSVLRFGAKADGEYVVQIRDQRGRGGPEFVYRLEVAPITPALSLAIERVDSRRAQYLQEIVVPRGNRFAVLIRVDRRDVGGPIAIEAPTLPVGVTLSAFPLIPELQHVPVVFEAAADAPLDGGLYEIRGRLARDGGDLLGRLSQYFPLVVGPPNDTPYYTTAVSRPALAVTDAAPFKVQLVAPAAPLLKNGSIDLKILVERAEGFKGDVTARMLWNPPGVGANPTITIPADKTEASYTLNAAGDAPARTYKIALSAVASVGGGEMWVSSQLVDLTVAEPFVSGTIQMAATEQGKPTTLLCKLEPARPFEGKAGVTLLGLPPKVTATPREITAADREIIFDLTAADDAPAGQHGGLFCELTGTEGGQPVRHRFAFNGVLRIDAPKPAVAAAPAPGAPAPSAPAPPKPLSRLDQLRKEATEKQPASQPAPESPKGSP